MYKESNALLAFEWENMPPKSPAPFHPIQNSIANWLNDGREVRLVRIHRERQRKMVAEFEIARRGATDRSLVRCIGKTYADQRGQQIFDAQRLLWEGGFCPPSPLTVACPIAYIDEARLFVQEKAPGSNVGDLVFKGARTRLRAVVAVARWLAQLHSFPIETPARLPVVRSRLLRYGIELAQTLPAHAKRIEELSKEMLSRMEDVRLHSSWVPSHGDLHPANVYVARNGRVTAIDLDTVGAQEREADVGYFLAQTAIMGYFLYGKSFKGTQAVRDSFLAAYADSAKVLRTDRIGLYVGHAFLQSLHYEICVLKNDKPQIVEAWLRNAENGLAGGPLAPFAEPKKMSRGAACTRSQPSQAVSRAIGQVGK